TSVSRPTGAISRAGPRETSGRTISTGACFASGIAGSVDNGTCVAGLTGGAAAAITAAIVEDDVDATAVRALAPAPAATDRAGAATGFNCSAILALVQRNLGSRLSACFEISRYGSRTAAGLMGSACSLNGNTACCCVTASTNATPSDQTSAAGVQADVGSSGAS